MAAEGQSNGLLEINAAVSTMDRNTQKNAAMLEETTAATYKLSAEAESLARQFAHFKLSQLPGPEQKGRNE